MFNEATRVQLPALVHLTRLGFSYIGKISKKGAGRTYDPDTNILLNEFKESCYRLNPDRKVDFDQLFQTIKQELDYDDLGRTFYKRLISSGSEPKLIDFENPKNNTFYCTGEFECSNGDESFRPDITLFINGLPLVYIEVKKPNNREGIVSERKRECFSRFPNKKFRRFNNITQLIIFSNNMEYDAMGGIVPVQGAFYCTNARAETKFNCFREENNKREKVAPFYRDFSYLDIDENIERRILSDFHCQVLLDNPEYKKNKEVLSPTNRILTSMCSRERLLYILKYAIAYLKEEKEEAGRIIVRDEKHIMRYQQLFASLAIKQKIKDGVKSGIVWHTQGSGKTALAYYLSNILTDYYASKNVVPKFYFIVDRIDLLEQATGEFSARGLKVITVDSRDEMMAQFRTFQAQNGDNGEREITVVNIQKFKTDVKKVELKQYATNLQRIFIIDEAHRGYKPNGCFLSNLFAADRDSIKIALTGTPLIGEERKSCEVFGNYLHTYYYDRSIQDGYTLKIIREEIETSWKNKLQEAYKKLDVLVQKKELRKNQIIEHPSFINPLFNYISRDLIRFRSIRGDKTLGGMVICETSEQARALFKCFEENLRSNSGYGLHAGLILHDSDDKETRKQIIKDFKKNMTIDILIVFNMLLTGFDAPRLKRLYFGRKIKDHNLLQAITRVNRPYKDNRYGYLIDFANIQANFDETNEAYLKELNAFNAPVKVGEANITDTFSQVLEDKDKIISQMNEIRDTLFNYPTNNLEEFSQTISEKEEKNELVTLRRVLDNAKNIYNLVATFGDDDLKEKIQLLDPQNLNQMFSEVKRRIDILNFKESFNTSLETQQLINDTMAEIQFNFKKIGENELRISGKGELQDKYATVINAFTSNYDQEDPKYIELRELFLQRCKEHNFVIESVSRFNEELAEMDRVLKRLKEIKLANDNLRGKYDGDVKFVRVHKRLREEIVRRNRKIPSINNPDPFIYDLLKNIKSSIDHKVYNRRNILKQDAYFSQTVSQIVSTEMEVLKPQLQDEDIHFVQQKITKQYQNQYNDTYALCV